VLAFKVTSKCNMNVAAIALAQPRYRTPTVLADRLDCDQMTEAYSCDIQSVGHRSAPAVRVSSGEAGAINTDFAAHYSIKLRR
jgi:hypothetical protein